MKVVTVIPARGGSKGIPRKNLVKVGSIPLAVRSINASLASGAAETWVSTEDPEIRAVALAAGAMVLDRPAQLAEDTVSTEDVLLHFSAQVDFDAVVLLQCTCPFTTPADINAAIDLLVEYDSVLTVARLHQFIWREAKPTYDPHNRPRRQDAETTHLETGGLFGTSRSALLASRCRISGGIGFVEVPRHRAIDIDSEEDLQLARAVARSLVDGGAFDTDLE